MLKISTPDRDSNDITVFGGKANGIYLLNKCGYRIPRTIFIENTKNCDDLNDAEFLENLECELSQFKKMNGKYQLAIRSSCTLEDGFTESAAGRFQSFLGTFDFSELLQKMKIIVLDFISKNGSQNAGMGIVIQELIKAEYAGVVFTSNPLNFSKHESVLSYTVGYGDKLVSGEDNGSELLIKFVDGNASVEEPVPFGNALLSELANQSKKIENLLEFPLDIEWALADNKIFFIQCRPLTSITRIASTIKKVSKNNLNDVPNILISHDKISLRLISQDKGIAISDAYIYVENFCRKDPVDFQISKSEKCKGYSAVIIYPRRISEKVVRTFVGEELKTDEKALKCCRYGVKSFPKYEDLSNCLCDYSVQIKKDYWIGATIIQEIYNPKYTGVIQKNNDGYIIEIIRGHFLTKGFVETSQYIVEKNHIVEKKEVYQHKWYSILEGHVIECFCDNEEESLVTISEADVILIINYFAHILTSQTENVEFGLLYDQYGGITPYLIDFVDSGMKLEISSAGISKGIISSGIITGRAVYVTNGLQSFDLHFADERNDILTETEPMVFFCDNPDISLTNIIDKYGVKNIGFVFATGSILCHFAVLLREKGIPAIKIGVYERFEYPENTSFTVDAISESKEGRERIAVANGE